MRGGATKTGETLEPRGKGRKEGRMSSGGVTKTAVNVAMGGSLFFLAAVVTQLERAAFDVGSLKRGNKLLRPPEPW